MDAGFTLENDAVTDMPKQIWAGVNMRGNHWAYNEEDLTIMLEPLDKALYHHDDKYQSLLTVAQEMAEALEYAHTNLVEIDGEDEVTAAALQSYNKLMEGENV